MTTATMNIARAPIFSAQKMSAAQLRAKWSDLAVPAGLTGSSAGIVVRATLALIPFAGLAWMFAAV